MALKMAAVVVGRQQQWWWWCARRSMLALARHTWRVPQTRAYATIRGRGGKRLRGEDGPSSSMTSPSEVHVGEDTSIDNVIRPFDDTEKERIERELQEELEAQQHAADRDALPRGGLHYEASSFDGELMSLDDLLGILEASHALDVVVVDMRAKCSFCHYMVFATGQNARHMHVMASRVVKDLRRRRISGLRPEIEGEGGDTWVLVDCGTMVFHAFSPEGRAFYDLERKWAFTHHRIDQDGDLQPVLDHTAEMNEVVGQAAEDEGRQGREDRDGGWGVDAVEAHTASSTGKQAARVLKQHKRLRRRQAKRASRGDKVE